MLHGGLKLCTAWFKKRKAVSKLNGLVGLSSLPLITCSTGRAVILSVPCPNARQNVQRTSREPVQPFCVQGRNGDFSG
jgi:hypothetical protein